MGWRAEPFMVTTESALTGLGNGESLIHMSIHVTFTPEASGAVAVGVHQVVHDLSGKVLLDRMVDHVYFFKESLISRMEIRE